MKQIFAILLMSDCSIKLQRDMQLTDEISLYSSMPFALEEHWKRWLGSLRCEEIEKSNFTMMYKVRTDQPQILGDEHESVHQKLYDLYSALLFLGVPSYSRANLLVGSIVDAKTTISQVSTIEDSYVIYDGAPLYEIEFDKLLGIHRTFNLLFTKSNLESDKYFRFRHGITGYLKALREKENYYRIHQLVRAIEALILPKIGQTEKQFVHKCMRFVKHTPTSELYLKEIYKLRSNVEHIHPLLKVYQELTSDEGVKTIDLRGRMIEEVTRFSYQKILLDQEVLNLFLTNDTIESFWGLSDKEKDKVWGGKIDLSKIK